MLILRLPEVKRRRGFRADASVYNEVRDGLCTIGVAISQRSKGWPDYEIDAINTARVAGKSDAEIRELVKALHDKRTDPANALATV
jgi:prophage regulatory protein